MKIADSNSFTARMFLAPQSVLIAVVLGVLTLIAAVGTIVNYSNEALAGLLLWVAVFAVVIYDTECLANSPCGVWSWIRTALWSLIPIFAIVTIVTATIKNRRRIQRLQQNDRRQQG